MKRLVLALLLMMVSCHAPAQFVTHANDSSVILVPNAGLTTVMNINTAPLRRIMVMCKATGQALSAFTVSVAPVNNLANPVTIASIAGDYSSPVAPLIRVIGTPVTLAATATAMFLMDTSGIDTVIVQATSANAAGTTMTCFSSGS